MDAGQPNPSTLKRIAKFFFASCVIGGVSCGTAGALFVLVSAMIDPNSVRFGGSNDPAGMAMLMFVAWGMAGLAAGLVIGLIGALVIAIRR